MRSDDGTYQRDPVSELFDTSARRLLDRAYAHPGQWAATRLANPSLRHLAWLAAHGINPYAPDRPSAQGGRGLNARTTWARGFIRAVYHQHKWYSGAPGGGWRDERRTTPRQAGALQVEVGRAVPVRGIIPAGRAVRIRLRPGGQAARKAVRKLPDSARIFTDRGEAAARWSDPDLRDW